MHVAEKMGNDGPCPFVRFCVPHSSNSGARIERKRLNTKARHCLGGELCDNAKGMVSATWLGKTAVSCSFDCRAA